MAEIRNGSSCYLWDNSRYVTKIDLFEHSHKLQSYHDAYHLLVPGEYIAIVSSGLIGNADYCHWEHGVYIIAKVISAQKKNIFNGGGSAVLEFHDGTTGKVSSTERSALSRFFPKEQFINCYKISVLPEFDVFSFKDRVHLLKCMEERDKVIAKQNEFSKIYTQEKQKEEAIKEAARRRNASVSDDDLSKAFHGEAKSSGYDYLHCPKCGTNLRVPLNKGKIEVKCPNCKFTFITNT